MATHELMYSADATTVIVECASHFRPTADAKIVTFDLSGDIVIYLVT